jgi:hypothetical protein
VARPRGRGLISRRWGEREREGGGPGLRREPGVLARSLSRHRGGGGWRVRLRHAPRLPTNRTRIPAPVTPPCHGIRVGAGSVLAGSHSQSPLLLVGSFASGRIPAGSAPSRRARGSRHGGAFPQLLVLVDGWPRRLRRVDTCRGRGASHSPPSWVVKYRTGAPGRRRPADGDRLVGPGNRTLCVTTRETSAVLWNFFYISLSRFCKNIWSARPPETLQKYTSAVVAHGVSDITPWPTAVEAARSEPLVWDTHSIVPHGVMS